MSRRLIDLGQHQAAIERVVKLAVPVGRRRRRPQRRLISALPRSDGPDGHPSRRLGQCGEVSSIGAEHDPIRLRDSDHDGVDSAAPAALEAEPCATPRQGLREFGDDVTGFE